MLHGGFLGFSQPLTASDGADGEAGGHHHASCQHQVQGSFETPLFWQDQFTVAKG